MRSMSHGLDLNKNTLSLEAMGDLLGGQSEDFRHRKPPQVTFHPHEILTWRARQGEYYCGVGHGKIVMRDIVVSHYKACLCKCLHML